MIYYWLLKYIKNYFKYQHKFCLHRLYFFANQRFFNKSQKIVLLINFGLKIKQNCNRFLTIFLKKTTYTVLQFF